MTELLSNLSLGFSVALTWDGLLYCFIGVLLGTAIGVLPGIGPVSTIALLLPITFSLTPTTALIMLAGIYYGAQYGGSITAILINLPGEPSSAVTALDGYQLARQGKAGLALATSAIGSFFAGTIATFVLAALAPPLARVVINFGAEDYFSLMVLGLVGAVVLAQGSLLKAAGMVLVGLILGMVGPDSTTGFLRFTFGIPELADGIGFVVLATGIYALAEIIANLSNPESRPPPLKPDTLFPKVREILPATGAIVRGTLLGSILGILPGGGALLSSFASYALEKKISRHPERFGKGELAGVAGPESANNAGAQTSFVPLLTLGIPPNPVMALMIGAMTIHAIQPGPQVMTSNPGLFWGLIASMWIGNVMLVLLNLPLVGAWVRLLTIPYRFMYPAILAFACFGVFVVLNSTVDLYLTALFGLVGFVLIRVGGEPAPLLLGFVLGPMMEENLRRAMLISEGDASVFLTSPISATLLAVSMALLLVTILPAIRRTRRG